MGRGSANNQALDSARQLLFGTRRSQPLSPEAKRRIQSDRRRQALRVKQDHYYQQFLDAADQLKSGNGEAFAQLLKDKAGHGLKAVEKEALRDLLHKVESYAYVAPNPDNNDATMIDSVDDLEGLVAIYERTQQNHLPKKKVIYAQNALLLYAQALANRRLLDQIELNQDEIGPLPTVVFGGDFSNHFLHHDKPLCGQDFYDDSYRQFNGRHSAIEETVDCSQCLELSENQAPDLMEPCDWVALLNRRDLNDWGYRDEAVLARTHGSKPEKAEQLVDGFYTISQQEINGRLHGYSSHLLGEKS